MKKSVILISILVPIIIVLCYFSILRADERSVRGTCILPANQAGIEVSVIYQDSTVASDATDSSGDYFIDANNLVEDRYYNFYATDGLGEHFWNFTYNGGIIEHDFALSVYK